MNKEIFMDNLRVERVKSAEWKEYRDLRLQALAESPRAFGMSYEDEKMRGDEYWKKIVQRYAMGLYDSMLVARQDGQMVGSTGFYLEFHRKKKHIATIVNVFVVEEFRSQGIARLLFDHVLAEIKKNPNILKIKLSVNPLQEAALKLYESYGFEVVGKLKNDLKIGEEFFDEWMLEKWIG